MTTVLHSQTPRKTLNELHVYRIIIKLLLGHKKRKVEGLEEQTGSQISNLKLPELTGELELPHKYVTVRPVIHSITYNA